MKKDWTHFSLNTVHLKQLTAIISLIWSVAAWSGTSYSLDWITPCEETIYSLMKGKLSKAPKKRSNRYVIPNQNSLNAFGNSLGKVLENREDLFAKLLSQIAEYSYCRGTGDESDWVLWYPNSEVGNGQALVLINFSDNAKQIIFEVPHPFGDPRTFSQGHALFKGVGARALIVSGTHRCANSTPSGCDGRTRVCGGSSQFRISDAAHSDQGIFHKSHVLISEFFDDHLVVSVHGMRNRGISLSDGTTNEVESDSPLALLAGSLRAVYGTRSVTTCNRFTGNRNVKRRLCGTSNVQGRHLNGSDKACTEKALHSSARFIHMEQSMSKRSSSNYSRTIRAFNSFLEKLTNLGIL